MLNKEQRSALSAVKNGKNLFLTGAAGTGKSYTIQSIVSWASVVGKTVAVTAMTGCAALLLGIGTARTLHSWAGVGLARESAQELAESVARNKKTARRWQKTDILIIDEVSMMTAELLEKLDIIGRHVRKRGIRFGGLQIVLTGDFCQLPPVAKVASFVFEAPIWTELIDEVHQLTEILRQRDPIFQKILTEARMGELSAESLAILESRKGLSFEDSEIRPTLLFTRNATVNEINRKNMDALDGEQRIYKVCTVFNEGFATKESISSANTGVEKLDKDAPYDTELEIRMGAQVMLITNLDQERGLVNGSRGVVVGYSLGGLPVVRFKSYKDPIIVERATWWMPDNENVGRAQIPLRIAYAMTIHKSQGATLDCALIDVGSSTFEYGQAYTALSRVQSLEGLYIWKLDQRMICCHPAVKRFYASMPVHVEVIEVIEPTVSEPTVSETTIDLWNINELMDSPTGKLLQARLAEIKETVIPTPENRFTALALTPDPAAVRVIILGQDPYHTLVDGKPIAHGLAFSSKSGIPPSLRNIYKELASDLSVSEPKSGDLSGWAAQGVLLLNDVLTVTAGKPQSHCGLGWEEITGKLIEKVLIAAPHVVIVAWGRNAQKRIAAKNLAPLITQHKHTVLNAPHPSPLSAHTGFFGSKPFSQANAALKANGVAVIDWVKI